MSEIDLSNTTALVTGGGRGLGRVMALRLAAEGARVAIAARSADQLAETVALVGHAGGTAVPFVADVTDADAVERLMADTERALGPLDLLVNNAGHGGTPGPVWELDPDDWWTTQSVNVRGPFLCMRAALRRMVARGRGRIVNVSSRAGNATIPFASAYATSKTALTRLSEIAAAEARPHGVLVFAIEPGTVRTTMTERLLTSDAGRTWLPWYRAAFDEGRDAPPEAGATLVARIAAGHADALAGRFLSRADDLDALAADAESIVRDDRLVLRLTTADGER
ncbi:MAG: SDR family oxidoreductase [Gemmatirosa sp.]|nr:SDR family oxidoreductase [Gemmatirosa sp.]